MMLAGLIVRTVGVLLALALCSCVTHATIHARKVTVNVSPRVQAQGLPFSIP